MIKREKKLEGSWRN